MMDVIEVILVEETRFATTRQGRRSPRMISWAYTVDSRKLKVIYGSGTS